MEIEISPWRELQRSLMADEDKVRTRVGLRFIERNIKGTVPSILGRWICLHL